MEEESSMNCFYMDGLTRRRLNEAANCILHLTLADFEMEDTMPIVKKYIAKLNEAVEEWEKNG